MAAANRPSTLVEGWEGAWGLNVRKALAAIRDEGPLTLQQVAVVLRSTALHSDLTSGHRLGPMHGAEMLARAILEDAAAVVVVDGDDRYSVPSDLTSFTSPFTGQDLRLLTVDEQAAAKALADTERPVRRWAATDAYSPYGGKWTDGQLPSRQWTTDEVVEKAGEIEALGWLPGARIVKDQRGVIIEGHLRDAALRWLAIDPDTGVDPRSGEPYVEIRAFNNDAARLDFALTANWSTLTAPTKKAIAKQVLGKEKAADLTLDAVTRLIRPLAEIMATPPRVTTPAEPAAERPQPTVVAVTTPAKPVPPLVLNADYLDMLEQVRRHGHSGATYKDVDSTAHGSVSGNLSRLHQHGHLVRLTETRMGCHVYVVPEFQHGRPEKPHGSTNPSVTLVAVPDLPPDLPPAPAVVYSNERVAAMAWREAAIDAKGKPYLYVETGKARLWIGALPSADRPVAEHIDAIIADLNAKLPWLLPMICERLAQGS